MSRMTATPPSGTPGCFDSHAEFKRWLAAQKFRGERASICDDCTSEYEASMTGAQRCDKAAWAAVVFAGRKRP